MPSHALKRLLALSLTLFLAACSGSSGSSGGVLQDCTATGENVFCLTSCTLGCSQAGCNINRISQNEPITLSFSQAVDPFSVPPHTTSITLNTATGEQPVGDWVVESNRVTFMPAVLISGGTTFYGFRPNMTYTLRVSAVPTTDVIRSMSGDGLAAPISCTLSVGGITDLNSVAPEGRMITPALTGSVQLDTKIVVEFNEILDPAIFADITSETSPIRYSVKSTQEVGGEKVCRASSEAVLLPGEPIHQINAARGRSIVSFVPQENLPGNKCVEVEITSKVRDLAGVAAKPHVLQFVTRDVGVQQFSNKENFTTTTHLDLERSAGSWGNGQLIFSPIGGSGRHGVFDPSHGRRLNPASSSVEIWEWSTDSQQIPATHTTSGQPETVTNGEFFFQAFEIPDGVEVHFVGSNPARIWVGGNATIGGLLAVNGESLSVGTYGPASFVGQPGGRGAAFGSRGGNGGNRGDGLGHKVDFDGRDGQDIHLPAGHAYASQEVGTGGKGSPQWPTSGLEVDLKYDRHSFFSVQANRGGGGGGFTQPGGEGRVSWDPGPDQVLNTSRSATGTTPGGKALAFPIGVPVGHAHHPHYLVGGSGGGGGGSAPTGAVLGQSKWHVGLGGGGGGGALGMRVGSSLVLSPSGRIEARGGSGPAHKGYQSALTPGGGGSGGSLFLQVNGSTSNLGTISVEGGVGGRHIGDDNQILLGIRMTGGDGGPGILKFEVSGDPQAYPVGRVLPKADIAKIETTDLDDIVAVRSLWYAASLLFPPDFIRYEIHATVDSVPVVYSDDPQVGVLASGGVPLRFRVQGAKLEKDPVTGRLRPKDNTPIKPFRDYVGTFGPNMEPALADDGATGYRFEITLDRSFQKTVEVHDIIVYWRL